MSQIYENLVDLRHAATDKSAKPDRELAAQFVSQFTMKHGAEVTLRPVRLDDEPLMAKFHQTLSDRSVYMRYFCFAEPKFARGARAPGSHLSR